MGKEEGEAGAVESEEGEGVREEGGLGSMGMEGGGEEGEVEDSAGLVEGKGEEVRIEGEEGGVHVAEDEKGF